MEKQIKKAIMLTDIEFGRREHGEIIISKTSLVGKHSERSLKKYADNLGLVFVEKINERTVIASMSEEKFLNHADVEEEQLSLEIE